MHRRTKKYKSREIDAQRRVADVDWGSIRRNLSLFLYAFLLFLFLYAPDSCRNTSYRIVFGFDLCVSSQRFADVPSLFFQSMFVIVGSMILDRTCFYARRYAVIFTTSFYGSHSKNRLHERGASKIGCTCREKTCDEYGPGITAGITDSASRQRSLTRFVCSRGTMATISTRFS